MVALGQCESRKHSRGILSTVFFLASGRVGRPGEDPQPRSSPSPRPRTWPGAMVQVHAFAPPVTDLTPRPTCSGMISTAALLAFASYAYQSLHSLPEVYCLRLQQLEFQACPAARWCVYRSSCRRRSSRRTRTWCLRCTDTTGEDPTGWFTRPRITNADMADHVDV